jgi:hypothetical protein
LSYIIDDTSKERLEQQKLHNKITVKNDTQANQSAINLLRLLAKHFPQFINGRFRWLNDEVTLLEYWFRVFIQNEFEFSRLDRLEADIYELLVEVF